MPQDLLNRIISDLQQLSQQVGDVSNIKERSERAKADLDSLNNQRETALAQTREAQGLLTRAQADAQKSFDQDMFNKQGQLKSLMERIAETQKKLDAIAAELDEKESRMKATNKFFADAKNSLANW